MLKGTIGIVHIPVEDDSSICLLVSELNWHGLERTVEDTWVIDIVPSVEVVVSSLKHREAGHPEVLSILIQEVHKCGVAWPCLSVESLSLLILDEDIVHIVGRPILILN